ncbi:MAG: glycine cleavage system protein GcvH [Candidatus Omnitrophica bacterium]|nr:glycine cleavage system protein GcvH [Candidatus Omnitrophota bacterium]
MNFPSDLKYAKTHEWARTSSNEVTCGITEYAQKELSDVVYVELPKIGAGVKQGVPCCIVESVKAAFDIYAPVSGTITAVNSSLEAEPAKVNRDPYGEGWFFKIKPSSSDEFNRLMSAQEYEHVLSESAH